MRSGNFSEDAQRQFQRRCAAAISAKMRSGNFSEDAQRQFQRRMRSGNFSEMPQRQFQRRCAAAISARCRSGNFSELLEPNTWYNAGTVVYDPSSCPRVDAASSTPFPNNIIPASKLSPNGVAILSPYPAVHLQLSLRFTSDQAEHSLARQGASNGFGSVLYRAPMPSLPRSRGLFLGRASPVGSAPFQLIAPQLKSAKWDSRP
jgi:hypothetical protein